MGQERDEDKLRGIEEKGNEDIIYNEGRKRDKKRTYGKVRREKR